MIIICAILNLIEHTQYSKNSKNSEHDIKVSRSVSNYYQKLEMRIKTTATDD